MSTSISSFKINGLICKCTETNIHIEDSYKIKDVEIPKFLIDLKQEIERDFNYKRSIDSWTKEWIAHNRLYKLGLFRSHTKDLDLDENESKFRLVIYNIIGN